MTKPELYRTVFQSPEGREVLADICRYVETMNLEQPGSAGQLIAHIIRLINAPEPATNGAPPRATKASGGRIAHG